MIRVAKREEKKINKLKAKMMQISNLIRKRTFLRMDIFLLLDLSPNNKHLAPSRIISFQV